MPPRSEKMKRFIFGFQRRVWWPKWRPARLEADAQERVIAQELHHLEMGHRLARSVRVERPTEWIRAVASDRSLDRPAPRLRTAAHEREVLALELAAANEPLQTAERL